MTSPLAPDIVEACARILWASAGEALPFEMAAEPALWAYQDLAKSVIRAFLANWRPEVSQAMLDAACTAYDECFRVDIEAIRGSMSAALKASLDTMLAEALPQRHLRPQVRGVGSGVEA